MECTLKAKIGTEVRVPNDADLYDELPDILFTTVDGFIDFSLECASKPKKWDKLAIACGEGGRASVDYCPCNGEANIMVKDGVVAFEVAKFGNGCGGSLVVRLKAAGCVDAFRDAAALTRSWMSDISCPNCGTSTKKSGHARMPGRADPVLGHVAPCPKCGDDIYV